LRFEYQYIDSVTITEGHNRRVYSERIEPGWILTVTNCYIYVPEVGTPDKVIILVEAGAQEIVIRARGKEVGRLGISSLTPFVVGEYQRIIGYAPQANVGDSISLNIGGWLSPLWDWRKRPGGS